MTGTIPKPAPKIAPRNLTAQMQHRARGNPPGTMPDTAISNCFPGLEFDVRVMWRRMLVGITLSECTNYVVATDEGYEDLLGRRLLRINERPLAVQAQASIIPGRGAAPLSTKGNPDAAAFMEWSNSFAVILDQQGKEVTCEFTLEKSVVEVLPGNKDVETMTVDLKVRHIFERNSDNEQLGVIAGVLASPGELGQGLCSPWQNDYRECACYYWAASRPDFVNVVPADDGTSRGDNWMQKTYAGQYLPDEGGSVAHHSYDDLFVEWEKLLRFVVGGVAEPAPE